MRRKLFAIIASLGVFGAALAMAASLGGISGGSLGADSTVVASCDADGVTTSYTTSYDDTAGEYVVTSVTVGGVANACDGKSISVTLSRSNGTAAGSGTTAIPVDGASTSVTVTLSSAASAENASNVHVLIA
jgi:hypothetical protein